MENTRLKVKLGAFEFEAEGPPDQVTAQFAAWKEMLTLVGHAGQPATTTIPPAGKPAAAHQNTGERSGAERVLNINATLPPVFDLDDAGLVSLKAHPSGDDRDADAVLMVLYGYKRRGVNDVLVGRLKDSLERSGLRPDRIDKTVLKYTNQGLVLKNGRGPGGRYHLSNTGFQRAEQLTTKLSEQMA